MSKVLFVLCSPELSKSWITLCHAPLNTSAHSSVKNDWESPREEREGTVFIVSLDTQSWSKWQLKTAFRKIISLMNHHRFRSFQKNHWSQNPSVAESKRRRSMQRNSGQASFQFSLLETWSFWACDANLSQFIGIRVVFLGLESNRYSQQD